MKMITYNSEVEIYIPKPPLFSFKECLWYLDRGYNDCLHKIENDHTFIKLIVIKNRACLIRITEEVDYLRILVLNMKPDEEAKAEIIEYVNELFDLKRDLSPFYNLLNNREDLKHLSTSFQGLRLIGTPDLFEALGWSIIGQQINLTFAHALKRRLVERFGKKETYEEESYYLFPTPEDLSQVSIEELKTMQFSSRKAEYLLLLASLLREGKISKEYLLSLNNVEAMRENLIKIKGIGEWTANYALLKSLKILSCIPFGDSGLKNALQKHQSQPTAITRDYILEVFKGFEDWEGYLVFYLWRSLSVRV